MSKKVVPALIALIFALAWLSSAFLKFPLFAIIVGIIAAVAVYEVENAIGMKYKPIQIITMLYAAVGPVVANYEVNFTLPSAAISSVYVIAVLIIMVIKHERTDFKNVATSVFSSFCLCFGFTTVIYIRDLYATYPDIFYQKKSYGIFFLLFGFFCSWLTDTMAFFAGSFFGKHKMCPKISPNKTIEGAIGGVIGNTVLCLVMLAVFRHFFSISVGYLFTAIVAIPLSVVSIFGDLAASVIKRQSGIKDFGNLIPGTGGIMDRFDSSLFVLPLLYGIVYFCIEVGATNFIFS